MTRSRASERGGAEGMGDVESTIEVGGALRPMTNSAGRLIHPTEDGVRNFWRWFGDSKMVDANGEPLVVYHGTSADVTEFHGPVSVTSRKDVASFYAVASRNIAEDHRNIAEDQGKRGTAPNVMPVYVRLENPKRVDSFDLENSRYEEGFIEEAIKEGHDGLVLESWRPGDSFNEVVVFSAEQIKSAIGNPGTFDPSDPRLTDGAGDRIDARDTVPEPRSHRRRHALRFG